MTRDLLLLALFAGWLALLPWWLVRGSRRYLVWDVAGWLALAASIPLLALSGISAGSPAVLPAVMALKLAALFLFWIRHPGEIRWSPAAAGVFVLGILLLAGAQTLESNVDGDEAYYILQAESLIADGDLDLRNQYAALERSVTGRLDLAPQFADPVGPSGEQYSRHEPLLAILLTPGVAAAGLWGAMATMALFGAALSVSLLKLLEESGASRGTLLRVWPLLSFAPPLLTYSARVWTEVPAAFCLSEAMRNAARRRVAVAGAWLVALSLFQLRFALIAIAFAAVALLARRVSWRTALLVGTLIALPLAIGWLATGSPFLTHQWTDLRPAPAWKYVRGFFGLLLDAQTGMLFQAPLWICGVLGLLRWRSLPEPARWAAASAIPYLILLVPRDEWHGGWSPPLRYVIVFAPLIALGVANLLGWRRGAVPAPGLGGETLPPRGGEGGGWLVPVAIWSAAVAIHALAWPGSLFRIATGESTLGEWLSLRFGSDFSRLLPSFIRPNTAAWAASIALVAAIAVAFLARWIIRRKPALRIPAMPGTRSLAIASAALIAAALIAGTRPAPVVEIEDAHVEHMGGQLYPERWMVARYRFTGGWAMDVGDRVRFDIEPGPAVMRVLTEAGATLRLNGDLLRIEPTGSEFAEVPVTLREGKAEIEVVEGQAVIDRIEHE